MQFVQLLLEFLPVGIQETRRNTLVGEDNRGRLTRCHDVFARVMPRWFVSRKALFSIVIFRFDHPLLRPIYTQVRHLCRKAR